MLSVLVVCLRQFLVAFVDNFSLVRWYLNAAIHTDRWDLLWFHSVGDQDAGPFT